jgi:serine/threonine protein kinase KIN1/2
MQIQYREIRGGFECIHAPSIDLNSLRVEPGGRSTGNNLTINSQDTSASSTIRRGVVRKASKLSFGTVRRKDKAKDGDANSATVTPKGSVPPSSMKEDDKDLPNKSSGSATAPRPPATTASKLGSPSGDSSSFFNVPSPSAQPIAEGTEETINGYGHAKKISADKDAAASVRTQDTEGENSMREAELPPDLKISAVAADDASTKRNSPTTPTIASRDKFLPPIPRDFIPPTPASPSTGKTPQANGQRQVTAEDLFEMTNSSNMVVRFEIMIVKVRPSISRAIAKLTLHSAFTGTVDTSSRDSVPTHRRRWMAIPNACPSSAD